jgi:hypothetical protein
MRILLAICLMTSMTRTYRRPSSRSAAWTRPRWSKPHGRCEVGFGCLLVEAQAIGMNGKDLKGRAVNVTKRVPADRGGGDREVAVEEDQGGRPC